MHIDAHLFLPNDAGTQNRPESDDPELTGNYPDWIHVGPYRSPLAQYLPMFSRLVKDLEGFDYVVLSQKGPSLAPYLKPKTIFYTTGADLTRAPFYGRSFRWYKSLPAKVAATARTFWQKRGIRKVDIIWSMPIKPFSSALSDIGVRTFNRKKYFPIIVDSFKQTADPTLEPIISKLKKDHDFIIFNPSRIMVDDSPDMVAMGQWKNNLALLEGFAKFVHQTGQSNAAFAIVDKGEKGREQRDRDIFLDQARKLNVEKQIVVLKAPNEQKQFTRSQLFALYDQCDVVGGDFGAGWFGSVVVEGLSAAKPVLCYLDEDVMKELYNEHPIINVREPDEIAAALSKLYKDKDYRLKVGRQSKAWYKKHHSPKGAKRRYIENMEFLRTENDA